MNYSKVLAIVAEQHGTDRKITSSTSRSAIFCASPYSGTTAYSLTP